MELIAIVLQSLPGELTDIDVSDIPSIIKWVWMALLIVIGALSSIIVFLYKQVNSLHTQAREDVVKMTEVIDRLTDTLSDRSQESQEIMRILTEVKNHLWDMSRR